MGKYERRVKNVRRLISERCGGSQAVFAEKTGLTANYVSRMLYPDGKKQKKRIAEDTVDRIEAAFDLGRGWLDDLVDPGEFAEVFDCLQRVPPDTRKVCSDSMIGIATVFLQATAPTSATAKPSEEIQNKLNPITTGIAEKPAETFAKPAKNKKQKAGDGGSAKTEPDPAEKTT